MSNDASFVRLAFVSRFPVDGAARSLLEPRRERSRRIRVTPKHFLPTDSAVMDYF